MTAGGGNAPERQARSPRSHLALRGFARTRGGAAPPPPPVLNSHRAAECLISSLLRAQTAPGRVEHVTANGFPKLKGLSSESQPH